MSYRKSPLVAAITLASLFSLCAVPLAAQKKDTKPADSKSDVKPEKKADSKPADADAPAPLLKSNVGLKSSRRTNDSATAGFNGLDPQGKVSADVLNAEVTYADMQALQLLAGFKPLPPEFAAFIEAGSLKIVVAGSKPADTKTDNKKKK